MTSGIDTLYESSAQDRARLVVRMALRAFGNGTAAADWLVQPSDEFDGSSPLHVAKESMVGCARVCQNLDALVPRRTA